MTYYNYHSKKVLNLYKKHLVTLEFHYKWYTEFNRGRDHFEDEPRTGRPRSALMSENIEVVCHLMNVDPHIAYQQRQDILQIGSVATESVLHDYLDLKKITYSRVSQLLIEAQKQDRVDYCRVILKKLDGRRSKRVYNIITGDESWFYYYGPQTKRQSHV